MSASPHIDGEREQPTPKSHSCCWEQKQPPACGQALEDHKQCCLCERVHAPKEEKCESCGFIPCECYRTAPKEDRPTNEHGHIPRDEREQAVADAARLSTEDMTAPKSLRDEIVEEFAKKFRNPGTFPWIEDMQGWLSSAIERVAKHYSTRLSLDEWERAKAEGYNAGREAERARILAAIGKGRVQVFFDADQKAIDVATQIVDETLKQVRSLITEIPNEEL